MWKLILTIGLVVGVSVPCHAQAVVYDPAVTFTEQCHRRAQGGAGACATAATQRTAADGPAPQHVHHAREVPASRHAPVRIHDFEGPTFLFSRAYNAALNYGDRAGGGFLTVSHPVADAAAALGRLAPAARRTLLSQLATLDLSDSAVISATHDTGQLRYNGRRELAAIDALERDVTNDSLEQSTTAVLDKVSGAELIAARQRQARIQILDGIVEQLLVDGKRTRIPRPRP